ncbi:hypothetical protein HK405_000293, partial [Cladochytrium tenue]
MSFLLPRAWRGEPNAPPVSTWLASSPPPPPPPLVAERELCRLGVPSPRSRATAVAHDPVQSLVAIGFADGSVLLVGAPPSLERLLPPATRRDPHGVTGGGAPVRFLRFTPGDRFLVSADADDELSIWDLAVGEPLHPPVHVGATITCIEAPRATGWLFVGLEN